MKRFTSIILVCFAATSICSASIIKDNAEKVFREYVASPSEANTAYKLTYNGDSRDFKWNGYNSNDYFNEWVYSVKYRDYAFVIRRKPVCGGTASFAAFDIFGHLITRNWTYSRVAFSNSRDWRNYQKKVRRDPSAYAAREREIIVDMRFQQFMADLTEHYKAKNGHLWVEPVVREGENLAEYTQRYVEANLKWWTGKDDYELPSVYQERLQPEFTDRAASEIVSRAVKKYTGTKTDAHVFTLSAYDRVHESYRIDSQLGSLFLKVPADESLGLLKSWKDNECIPVNISCHVDGKGRLSLSGATFCSVSAGKQEIYRTDPNAEYSLPVQVIDNGGIVITDGGGIKQLSDVDIDIPEHGVIRENAFAFIIANEKYKNYSNARFAINDGRAFKEYCKKTLGIKDKNIFYVENATLSDIRNLVRIMKNAADAYNGGDFIFYYSGHGDVDPSTSKSYILPSDAHRNTVEGNYGLANLYADLNSMKNAGSITVFLDACFSGTDKSSGSLNPDTRPARICPVPSMPGDNTVVFCATSKDQVAHTMDVTGDLYVEPHGVFTYHVLKKLKESRGQVTLGELDKYLRDEVPKAVYRVDSQTPQVLTRGEEWKSRKLQ